MASLLRTCLLPAMLAVAHAQGVITKAQGTKGSPASLPLFVQLDKADANVINDTEISNNVVNECGRTLLGGNIDIGQETEIQLSNNTVTQVTAGSTVAVTINQLNANGAGPFSCDMDEAGNIQGVTGQTALNVTEKDGGNGQITLTVTMPTNLACIGASTGNVCTVRCRNTAAAGPFGGCFAVQQTDIAPHNNTANTIETAQTLAQVEAQIAENQKDLALAVEANREASTQDQQGLSAVNLLLGIDSTASAVAAAQTTASTATGKKKGNKNKNKNNKREALRARQFTA
ncbi:GEgh16 protein [Xylariales sp. PMI_506]|nr:GEgh16 protein [Xylariales sp. PMI_506]